MKRLLQPIAFLLVACALSAASPVAASGPRPAASIFPKTIKVGASGVLKGTNFHSGEYWFFLVAVPNLKKPRAMRFVAESKPTRNGTVNAQVKIPLEPICGKGGIYAFNLSSQKSAIQVGTVTLTGCTAKGNPSPPPSPPGSGLKPPKPPKP
jgi:hypothetical protein